MNIGWAVQGLDCKTTTFQDVPSLLQVTCTGREPALYGLTYKWMTIVTGKECLLTLHLSVSDWIHASVVASSQPPTPAAASAWVVSRSNGHKYTVSKQRWSFSSEAFKLLLWICFEYRTDMQQRQIKISLSVTAPLPDRPTWYMNKGKCHSRFLTSRSCPTFFPPHYSFSLLPLRTTIICHRPG